jgi:hypothetical protein
MLVNFNSVCIGSIGSWRERCVVAVLFVAALSLFVFAELCATKQLWSKKRRSWLRVEKKSVTLIFVSKCIFGSEDEVAVFNSAWTNQW